MKRKLDLKASSLGNPGMSMKMGSVMVPVLLQAVPGMQGMMTAMMKQKMKP